MDSQFFLASGSPRRAEMLRAVGLHFERVPAEVVEVPDPGQEPMDYAIATASAKARAGALASPAALPVLGADTDVSLDGVILGKPSDARDAIDMLLRLSSRTHEVCTAVALAVGEQIHLATTRTRVRFGEISAIEAAAYWTTGEPRDKAGGYAIQGLASRWVLSIDGSYSGVVGLPLYETLELLARHHIHPAPMGDRTPGERS